MHRDGMGFDRDASFPFQIHRIEKLILHIAISHRVGGLEESIREELFCRDRYGQ